MVGALEILLVATRSATGSASDHQSVTQIARDQRSVIQSAIDCDCRNGLESVRDVTCETSLTNKWADKKHTGWVFYMSGAELSSAPVLEYLPPCFLHRKQHAMRPAAERGTNAYSAAV